MDIPKPTKAAGNRHSDSLTVASLRRHKQKTAMQNTSIMAPMASVLSPRRVTKLLLNWVAELIPVLSYNLYAFQGQDGNVYSNVELTLKNCQPELMLAVNILEQVLRESGYDGPVVIKGDEISFAFSHNYAEEFARRFLFSPEKRIDMRDPAPGDLRPEDGIAIDKDAILHFIAEKRGYLKV